MEAPITGEESDGEREFEFVPSDICDSDGGSGDSWARLSSSLSELSMDEWQHVHTERDQLPLCKGKENAQSKNDNAMVTQLICQCNLNSQWVDLKNMRIGILIDKTISNVQLFVDLTSALLQAGLSVVVLLVNWPFADVFQSSCKGVLTVSAATLKDVLEASLPSIVLYSLPMRPSVLEFERNYGTPVVLVCSDREDKVRDQPWRPCLRIQSVGDVQTSVNTLKEFAISRVAPGEWHELCGSVGEIKEAIRNNRRPNTPLCRSCTIVTVCALYQKSRKSKLKRFLDTTLKIDECKGSTALHFKGFHQNATCRLLFEPAQHDNPIIV